ncbi:UNKNOWN [Stylonychia lemnae]|uniref:Uncharacterized protein n=1 Tax=Stylonychia lemnae TaxID=5949 RepID=A0A078AXU2_STYLE|nr:UNKNOWN [Stylonychia lemnae]|eukprot:CDW87270.1 UNKNOWN [Stylonychia lemnae]
MMSQNLLPIQQAVEMHLQHHFNFDFADVAKAFLLKYNLENKFCFTTIASTRQLDEDRFEIVRRMENVMSSRPVYERIIFNRKMMAVQGFTFETENQNVYTECYCYKQDDKDSQKTIYNMFLYKNPGLKKMLRFKLHNWGVQTLENIIKKDHDLIAKLKDSKDKMIEKKDKIIKEGQVIIKEGQVIIKERINDLKTFKSSTFSSAKEESTPSTMKDSKSL